MAKVTQGAKVGAFALVTAVAAYAVYHTVSKDYGGSNGYVVHAYLPDASGLAQHSRVTIAGIPVGTIESIRLENGRARVDVRVNKDVDLWKDGTLGRKSSSLLGEYVIVLTPGTKEPHLKDGDEIQVMPEEGNIDDIKKDVGEIAKLVKEVAKQLAASVGTDQGGQNIRLILQNLADATDALNKTVRENRETIKATLERIDRITAQNEVPIQKITENLKEITDDVKTLTAAINGKGNGTGAEIKDTIDHLDKSSQSLESALSHIDHVADRLDKGEGTLGRLSKDETLINEVQSVAEGINNIVEPISRLQTIVGLRSDYNFLANTLKNYFELRLQPREDKFYMIQLINDPRGKTSFSQVDVETTNPNEPARYRTLTTTTTDAFRFSLQIARQLGPFRGRFGIIESTGGVGLDIILFNDRFEIVNDVFGFGEQAVPRYRVNVSYQFINRLWLLGGVDNVFVPGLRDYFVGLQLRFTDDDLKGILPFAGGATPK
jgi:phospholipid/cholesterol/gamma-HCH transport system substrate-binding protein